MEIIRNDDKILELKNSEETIEKYVFDEEINFNGLINFLLNLNLKSKIEFIDNLEEKSESEENLVKLINQIIEDYNLKVTELELFIKENVQ